MYKKDAFKKLDAKYSTHLYTGLLGYAMRYCQRQLEKFDKKDKKKIIKKIIKKNNKETPKRKEKKIDPNSPFAVLQKLL